MGCHSPSPTVPSSLFASFPFLTEKEARGSPRNGNYRRNLFCETPGKGRGRQSDTSAGEADGCAAPEKHVLNNFFCSCCPWWSEWGNGETAWQKDSTGHHQTASQAKGGRASLFTLTSRFSFHLQNGIFKNLIEKKYTREARDDRHLSHNCFQMLIFGPNGTHFIFQNHNIKRIKNTKILGVCSFPWNWIYPSPIVDFFEILYSIHYFSPFVSLHLCDIIFPLVLHPIKFEK